MIEIARIDSKERWNQELVEVGNFDLYHTYDYHVAHQNVDNGRPILISIRQGENRLLLPLLERKVVYRDEINEGLADVTSVYGYPGPISNFSGEKLFSKLWNELMKYLASYGYISLFSRMNSISFSERLLSENFISAGKTVCIDLEYSDQEQLQFYRKNHRRDIKKLVKNGFQCSVISLVDGIDDFMTVYNSTMDLLDASDYYYFDKSYYFKLFDNELSDIKLIRCTQEGEIACMGIFSFTNGIVQYHLGGTVDQFYRDAPTKLMFDYVRTLSNDKGMAFFHLGGGLASQEDNLFNFKRGFSEDVRVFYICKEILDTSMYKKLSKDCIPNDHFPLYRAVK